MADQPQDTVGRHIVILCHPGPDSFNHSVARSYCEAVGFHGQEAILRDLYAMNFDPVLKASERPGPDHPHPLRDVADELETIRRSDVFVMIYPIWFGSAPAMLKGYVDRVLGSGVDPGDILAHKTATLLGGRRMLSFTTSATTEIWLDEQGQPSALSTVFDRYLSRAFGMRSHEHVHFGHVVDGMGARTAAQHLQEVKEQAQRLCAELTAGEDPLQHDPAPEGALSH